MDDHSPDLQLGSEAVVFFKLFKILLMTILSLNTILPLPLNNASSAYYWQRVSSLNPNGSAKRWDCYHLHFLDERG